VYQEDKGTSVFSPVFEGVTCAAPVLNRERTEAGDKKYALFISFGPDLLRLMIFSGLVQKGLVQDKDFFCLGDNLVFFQKMLIHQTSGGNVSQSKEDRNKMETEMQGFYPAFSYPLVSEVLLAKATSKTLLQF
jgi:hypothetical protein